MGRAPHEPHPEHAPLFAERIAICSSANTRGADEALVDLSRRRSRLAPCRPATQVLKVSDGIRTRDRRDHNPTHRVLPRADSALQRRLSGPQLRPLALTIVPETVPARSRPVSSITGSSRPRLAAANPRGNTMPAPRSASSAARRASWSCQIHNPGRCVRYSDLARRLTAP
jgi:hypothetical protein